MSKLDDILDMVHNDGRRFEVPAFWVSGEYTEPDEAKQQIKDLMYAIISEANFETYDQGKFYRELRKKVEEL